MQKGLFSEKSVTGRGKQTLVEEIPTGVLSGCSWDALVASSDGSS